VNVAVSALALSGHFKLPNICIRVKETTMPSVDQLIVWIVVGLLGGGLAGALMTWERGGFGLFRNLALGLAGALIGGLLFRVFGIWPSLDKISISLRDVVAAFVGSLIVLAAVWIWRKFKSSEASP
jgi:uncharacterized membrane protein YeaQ/YmgE (transglycosylase-associated protein family)